MVLSKRERVFRTLELDGEPDMIPIHNMGFEHTSTAFQEYLKSGQKDKYSSIVKNTNSRTKYLITEQRFWNLDAFELDPFGSPGAKLKIHQINAPDEYPDCRLNPISGKIYKIVKQIETGLDYSWYIDGYFKNPELLYSYWDQHGRPSELINDHINYSPQIWEGFVEALSPYFYPMASLPVPMHEWLFEGMTLSRVAYFMRKKPAFIYDVMNEYTKTNLEIIKRYGEAGVDIAFYYDDLGYKEHSIFSIEQFKEFILPYYKQIYQSCKKNGMFIVHHSCGYIDKLLPHMADAGLNCIQSLEPAAGVDLELLKRNLGDRITFMDGIDSSDILNFGKPKDVEEEVKRCIKAAATGGGYFIGPSHNILNAPWENVLALRAAIEKYRKYPLKIS
ncbi:MAG: hypothetical protein EU535_00745 [Promethearchaeota archaeon]|nr:MAG: hypothetical protein EU535_00745 [Candidatus Lokiarchaeota archaeon]